jgi:L-ascorbate metabolism protein UlaG (beta-lactamase superfamily)
MIADEIIIKYIGGPTALFETAGLRFLTDPTFDPRGTDYPTNIYTLHKLSDPVIKINELHEIDFVLLSHDHHFDNLDNSGRNFLSGIKQVFTTVDGAKRLGGNSVGLNNWETVEVPTRDNRILSITGTPCRHGPVDGDRGPVTGFVLNYKGDSSGGVYITGDTVWYEGVEEVSKRFDIKIVVAFLGAAVVKNVGPAHLTMTVAEAVELAKHFKNAVIIPLHFEGWAHFTESKAEIQAAFEEAGLADRLRWAK